MRKQTTIFGGQFYTVCLSEYNVFSFGSSSTRAHGHEEEDIFPPKIISTLKNITSINCSTGHTACLDNDGNLFIFGSNEYGQLGIGVDKDTLQYTHVPQKIDIPSCIQVSCGEYFTMCLCENGFLYSFGYNHCGQLGLGNNQFSFNTPQRIELTDVDFVECGGDHTFCKTTNNKVYCCGSSAYGQLSTGNTTTQNTLLPCTYLPDAIIVDIKCGKYHTLLLTSNQEVYSCGSNEEGQLGRKAGDYEYSSSFQQIPKLSEITRIECGYAHSMCLDVNNDFYVFGHNEDGQLGLDDEYDEIINIPMKHPSLSNIIDFSRGGWHNFVKTSNNEIYAFGYNPYSQLGIKTEDKYQLSPIRVFEDNEDIWLSNIKSKAKSARSILPRPSNEDNSQPKKKK